MAVKILKLVTGDEIICEIVNTTVDTFEIKNPVRIVVLPSKNDPTKPSVGFVPWVEFSPDKEFKITRNHVVIEMTPIRQFLDQYGTMFSPVITRPSLIVPGQ